MTETWKVNGSDTTTAIWVETEAGERVCTVKNCDADADRASLIAAAPDMLAALHSAAASLEQFIKLNRIPASNAGLRDARAAIAKATKAEERS